MNKILEKEQKQRSSNILKNFIGTFGGVALAAQSVMQEPLLRAEDLTLPRGRKVNPYNSKKVRMLDSQSYKENHKKVQGRNMLCNCGSGKKYKYCCIKKGK